MLIKIARMSVLLMALSAPAAIAQISASNNNLPSSAATLAAGRYAYADVADLADHAPLVLDAVVRSAAKSGKPTADPKGVIRQRFYVEADVTALIRSPHAMASRVSYLVDMPVDSKGKIAKLKKQRVLLFAQPIADKPGMIQLVSPDAQLLWDATSERWARSVVTALLNTNAPARITGVSSAFHAPGNVTGTGETQIFLTSANGQPASLTISTPDGAQPSWSANFGEVLNAAAGIPPKDTLAWYRLACGLPERLPAAAFEDGGNAHQAKIDADYAMVRAALGPCTRTRPMIPVK